MLGDDWSLATWSRLTWLHRGFGSTIVLLDVFSPGFFFGWLLLDIEGPFGFIVRLFLLLCKGLMICLNYSPFLNFFPIQVFGCRLSTPWLLYFRSNGGWCLHIFFFKTHGWQPPHCQPNYSKSMRECSLDWFICSKNILTLFLEWISPTLFYAYANLCSTE